VPGSKAHVALTLGCVATLIFAGAARAEDPPRPDDVAAADAYRESVPTAVGPKPTGTGKKPTGTGTPTETLAPAVSARLGTDVGSTLLREVATSPGYGAPQRRLSLGPGPVDVDEEGVVSPPALPSVGATAGAVGDDVGRGRLALLVVFLLVILVGAVVMRLAGARAAQQDRPRTT
jgi:hypothetical protein